MADGRERLRYTAVAAIIFLYLVCRAAWVPICHDEVRTFQQYTITERFLPFVAHWDAANHPLCTLLGWVSYRLFGPGVFALRLFSLLAFPLYAVQLFRLGATLHDRCVRWCTWMALLAAPLLLEFFALYRGYGMAMAFLLLALHHAVRFLSAGGARALGWSMFGFGAATFASLSLLLVWAAWAGIAIALLLAGWRNAGKGRAVAILVISAAFFVAAAAFGQGLRIRGALYYGGDALVEGTIGSLCRHVLMVEPTRFLLVLLSVAGALLPWAALATIASGDRRPAHVLQVLCVGLLFADLAARWAMHAALGTPYPEDRTALHLVPLFVLSLAVVLDRAARARASWKWAALPLLFLPLRSLSWTNMDRTSLWPREAIPNDVFDLVLQHQRAAGRPLLIGGYRLNICPWNYGNYIRGRMMPEIDAEDHPQPNNDLMIMDPTMNEVPAGFHTLYTATTGHLLLLERDRPLELVPLMDTTISYAMTSREFITLWEPPVSPLIGQELLLRLEAPIRSPARPLDAVIALEVKDTAGASLHYISDELASRRLTWNGDTLLSVRRVPRLSPATGRVAFYFYDRRTQPMSIENARLRVYAIKGRPTVHSPSSHPEHGTR